MSNEELIHAHLWEIWINQHLILDELEYSRESEGLSVYLHVNLEIVIEKSAKCW